MHLTELNHPSSAVERESRTSSRAPNHGVIGHLSSDEELQQDVCAALLETPGLDARGIRVAVLGHGEVTLLGSVPTLHERALALRIARGCCGGRRVHAKLGVGAHPAA